MARLEKVGFAVLVLAAALAERACPQSVIIDSTATAELDSLARDSVEHIVCLYGMTAPGKVALLRIVYPEQKAIGTHNAAANPDDCIGALAMWHNHPVPRDSVAANYLYYSLTDEHSFILYSSALIAIVGVPGQQCMWTRLQVREGLAKNLTPLPAVPDQCMSVP